MKGKKYFQETQNSTDWMIRLKCNCHFQGNVSLLSNIFVDTRNHFGTIDSLHKCFKNPLILKLQKITKFYFFTFPTHLPLWRLPHHPVDDLPDEGRLDGGGLLLKLKVEGEVRDRVQGGVEGARALKHRHQVLPGAR